MWTMAICLFNSKNSKSVLKDNLYAINPQLWIILLTFTGLSTVRALVSKASKLYFWLISNTHTKKTRLASFAKVSIWRTN